MKNALTRRQLLARGVKAMAGLTLVQFLGGCSSVLPLTEPGQVLSNPNIQRLSNEARQQGYSLNLSAAVNPPVISGRYQLNGERIYPNSGGRLTEGSFTWRNQTSDRKIETDYSQITGQSGTSSYGEIIRGEASGIFTVYSRLQVMDAGRCSDVLDMIVDGFQYSGGYIEAVYLTAAADERCFSPTAGFLQLTLLGAAKPRLTAENADDYSLVALAEK